MTLVLGEVRSNARRGAGLGGPSIREVCLLGVEPAGEDQLPTPSLERVWASGQRMTWSGRTYRVKATGVRAGGCDEPLRYIHLSVLA